MSKSHHFAVDVYSREEGETFLSAQPVFELPKNDPAPSTAIRDAVFHYYPDATDYSINQITPKEVRQIERNAYMQQTIRSVMEYVVLTMKADPIN